MGTRIGSPGKAPGWQGLLSKLLSFAKMGRLADMMGLLGLPGSNKLSSSVALLGNMPKMSQFKIRNQLGAKAAKKGPARPTTP